MILNADPTLTSGRQDPAATSYRNYLTSTHWRDTRRQALEDGQHRCWACQATRSLHVHHKTYERVGHEVSADLVVLCKTCHVMAHRLVKTGRAKLDVAHVEVRRDFQGRISTPEPDDKALPSIAHLRADRRPRKKPKKKPKLEVASEPVAKTEQQLRREERRATAEKVQQNYEDRRHMRQVKREERGRLIA